VRVFAMRHGFAETSATTRDKSERKFSAEDVQRPLKPQGVAAAKAVARWMLDTLAPGDRPRRIEYSPAVRTTETAKIVAGILKIPACENRNLFMDKPAEMVIKALCDDKKAKRVMLVGHSDNIPAALRILNWLSGDEKYGVDPFATAEMRIFDVDRKTYTWDEIDRVLPSWCGAEDLY